ncbi:SIR2 family protein [Listeria sp. ILCC797]|uniref:SIR2 family NAD-dependent protein deacylase n=1 Tax=Listeria sp. ILCC797 TaxID=1918333 RepID=UPI000B591C85|nr:SIR2 family protein [Listeria sp. ILCC797]
MSSIKREEVFEKLFNAHSYGNLGLFIGAGFSKAMADEALGWYDLIKEASIVLELHMPEGENLIGLSMPELATLLCKQLADRKSYDDYAEAKNTFKEEICLLANWLPKEDKIELLKKLFDEIKPSWIVTTNYDLVLETILTGKSKSLGPLDYLSAPKGIIPIYHLHGVRNDPESIIIVQEDYVPLFRPTEYRQSKLAMTIRESTTLVLGYGLGDVNVLSAVDWSKNLYTRGNEYPYEIIQALWSENPKELPYRDEMGNLIIEISNIEEFLQELADYIQKSQGLYLHKLEELQAVVENLNNKEDEEIQEFITNQDFRLQLLEMLPQFEYHMISSYIEFLLVCINELWEKARKRNAFSNYDEYINILLDILIHYDYHKMPPRLFQILAEGLNRVLPYVGDYAEDKVKGTAYDATKTWFTRKDSIPKDTKVQLISYANKYRLLFLNRKLTEEMGVY